MPPRKTMPCPPSVPVPAAPAEPSTDGPAPPAPPVAPDVDAVDPPAPDPLALEASPNDPPSFPPVPVDGMSGPIPAWSLPRIALQPLAPPIPRTIPASRTEPTLLATNISSHPSTRRRPFCEEHAETGRCASTPMDRRYARSFRWFARLPRRVVALLLPTHSWRAEVAPRFAMPSMTARPHLFVFKSLRLAQAGSMPASQARSM